MGATGCDNLELLIQAIQESIPRGDLKGRENWSPERKQAFGDEVARRIFYAMVRRIRLESPALDAMVRDGRIGIVGARYDVSTGAIEVLPIDNDVIALQEEATEELSAAGSWRASCERRGERTMPFGLTRNASSGPGAPAGSDDKRTRDESTTG